MGALFRLAHVVALAVAVGVGARCLLLRESHDLKNSQRVRRGVLLLFFRQAVRLPKVMIHCTFPRHRTAQEYLGIPDWAK